MTLKAVTDVENTFLTRWPLILYCIIYCCRFFIIFLLILMTFIPSFALRDFRENQYGGHIGTTSQQVTNLSLACISVDWGKYNKVHSRTWVTRTLRGNEKQFELAGNVSYQGKFQWNFDQGKGHLGRVSGEFKLSQFELSRFYCTFKTHVPYEYESLSWLDHFNNVVMGRLLNRRLDLPPVLIKLFNSETSSPCSVPGI